MPYNSLLGVIQLNVAIHYNLFNIYITELQICIIALQLYLPSIDNKYITSE
jgi:hypothetical protein